MRRARSLHIRAAKGDHRMPAIVSGIGRKSNTNVVIMRPTATALRISSISDCLGIESDLTLYGLVHYLLGVVCAGEVVVQEVVAQKGFKAELAAIDDAARLRYGGLYHTQSVGYWPLTTSPDPSGVAVCVGAVVGVDVAVGVCVGVGVFVAVGICVGVSIAPLTPPPVEDSGVAVGSGVDVGGGGGLVGVDADGFYGGGGGGGAFGYAKH